MSPMLFNFYFDYISKEELDDVEIGMKINGKYNRVNNASKALDLMINFPKN